MSDLLRSGPPRLPRPLSRHAGYRGREARPLPLPLLVLALFLFLYNLSFIAAPSATTGRIVLVVLGILYLRGSVRNAISITRSHSLFVVVLAIASMWALLLATLGGDTVAVSRLFFLCTYSVLGVAIFGATVQMDAGRFLKGVALATSLQGMFIVSTLLVPPLRTWPATLLVQGGNIPFIAGSRPPGFSNGAGANLSLIQMLGVFASVWIVMESRAVVTKVCFIMLALWNLLSAFLVGRTGGLVGFALIGVVLLWGLTKSQRTVVVLVIASLFALGGMLLARDWLHVVLGNYLLEWVSEPFREGAKTGSLLRLMSQSIPSLTLETVLGTGKVEGEFGGNAAGHDAGYVQTYYAIGVVMAVMFYGTWFATISKYVSRVRFPILYGSLVVASVLVELKEPFVFKYMVPFVILGVASMSRVYRKRDRCHVRTNRIGVSEGSGPLAERAGVQ